MQHNIMLLTYYVCTAKHTSPVRTYLELINIANEELTNIANDFKIFKDGVDFYSENCLKRSLKIEKTKLLITMIA